MTLIFGIYFLVCPYTFSWESHPTKNMCTQSLALPSRPSCPPQDQLPWDSSRKCPQSLQPALPTSVSLLILFPFPKMSFRTIFKVSHPPPLWSLPWSPLAWNQTFLLKLLILYLNFSWSSKFLSLLMKFKVFILLCSLLWSWRLTFPHYLIKSMSGLPLNVLRIKDMQKIWGLEKIAFLIENKVIPL